MNVRAALLCFLFATCACNTQPHKAPPPSLTDTLKKDSPRHDMPVVAPDTARQEQMPVVKPRPDVQPK